MIISRPIHVAAKGIILFFFMVEKYSIIHVYHNFLIHPSVDGHLGCFNVLAIVNSFAMNTGVHALHCFELWFSLNICPRVGLQGHMVDIFLDF